VRGKLDQPGSLGTAALTSRKIEVKHGSSCFGCNGGAGRLIVRDALAKGHSVVALVPSKGERRSAGSRHDRGRCS
jgi:hypothetical protein